jgi:putative DNA primase/helicase
MKLDQPISIGSLAPPATKPVYIQLQDEIANSGLVAPDNIVFDGELHRFSSNGKPDDKAGWYVAHDGQLPAAAFGCWRLGLFQTWRADIGRSLSMLEEMQFKQRMTDAKVKRDAEKELKNETAAEKAHDILLHSTAASDSHEYLVKKGIKANGARVDGQGRLVIPICSDGHHKVTSIQTIDRDGTKQFMYGGAVAGCWYHIGTLQGANHVCIAEGFATAASIHEATHLPVAIAFNAGNLKSTAESVRELVGLSCTITICSDLDDSGVGETKANEAAQLIGARVVVSPTSSDFNDAALSGVDIASIINAPPAQDWLIKASDLVKSETTVKWMIKRWLPKNSMIMLHGPSGSGKSLVAMDMACRIASDLDDWQGHKVRHGTVIYLAGEGYIGMNARLRAWAEHNGVNPSTINMWISKYGCDLNQPKGYQLARESILAADKKPSVIVVDTLHRFMFGDENSAQDAGSMIKSCNDLMREFDCSVLLVHHTGVADGAQQRARGSSAWRGAMESEISVKPQDENMPMEIVNIKSKDAALAETKYMRIQSHKFDGWVDEDDEPVTGAVVISSDKAEKDSTKTKNIKNYLQNVFEEIGYFDKFGIPKIKNDDWIFLQKDEDSKKAAAKRKEASVKKKEAVESLLLKPVEDGYVVLFEVCKLNQ